MENYQDLLNKVKEAEKGQKLDLSSNEDLSIAIMNLIGIEEHLFFSGVKTGNKTYYDLLNQVREMRKDLLKKIITEYEGEVWCISKHLLAASMRLIEVGTKAQTKGDNQNAEELFKKSYQLYSLFWGLNLGLVKTDNLSKEAFDETKNHLPAGRQAFVNESASPKAVGTVSLLDKLGQIVKKAIDCCKE